MFSFLLCHARAFLDLLYIGCHRAIRFDFHLRQRVCIAVISQSYHPLRVGLLDREASQCINTGEDALDFLGMNSVDKSANFGILLGMCVILQGLGFLALRYKTWG